MCTTYGVCFCLCGWGYGELAGEGPSVSATGQLPVAEYHGCMAAWSKKGDASILINKSMQLAVQCEPAMAECMGGHTGAVRGPMHRGASLEAPFSVAQQYNCCAENVRGIVYVCCCMCHSFRSGCCCCERLVATASGRTHAACGMCMTLSTTMRMTLSTTMHTFEVVVIYVLLLCCTCPATPASFSAALAVPAASRGVLLRCRRSGMGRHRCSSCCHSSHSV